MKVHNSDILMEPEDGVFVYIFEGMYYGDQEFEDRIKLFEQAKSRKELYAQMQENLSPEEWTVIKERARKSIAYMYDNLDEWLPVAISDFQVGKSLTIEIVMLVASIERGVQEINADSAFKLQKAKEQLAAMRKLDIDDTDESGDS